MIASVQDRFDEKWMPEPYSGCWLWTHATQNKGYGLMSVDDHRTLAHRISYALHKGEIPKGCHVLHGCDTPACVNPEHLFLGSHQDNMQDRHKKGRTPCGEANGISRLTESDVKVIRAATGLHRVIAGRFGISRSNVGAIKNRLSWRHI